MSISAQSACEYCHSNMHVHIFDNHATESGLSLGFGLEPRPLPGDQNQDLQKLDSTALETQDLGLEITRL